MLHDNSPWLRRLGMATALGALLATGAFAQDDTPTPDDGVTDETGLGDPPVEDPPGDGDDGWVVVDPIIVEDGVVGDDDDVIFWITGEPDGGIIVEDGGDAPPADEGSEPVPGEDGGDTDLVADEGDGSEFTPTVLPTSVCDGCEFETLGPVVVAADSGPDQGSRRDSRATWTGADEVGSQTNLCTDPQLYVAWLCAWQGYPQP